MAVKPRASFSIRNQADSARAEHRAPRAWFRFQNQADDPSVVHLWIYDVIGDSFWNEHAVSAVKLLDELKAIGDEVKTIRVHVNSPGGDVFDAIAIANSLRAQSTEKKRAVEMSIEGLAASAATIVTCAGDVIRIGDNALFMIHDPWAWAMGTAKDMRSVAESLEKVRDGIVATYRWVSSLSAEKLSGLMAATTWMTADEALENGFVTEIVSGLRVAAEFRPDAVDRLGDVPEKYRGRLAALLPSTASDGAPGPTPAPTPAPVVAAEASEVLRLCREGGCLELAEGLVTAKAPVETVNARVAYAREIRGLCEAAKFPELAAGYIAGNMPSAQVRAQLTTITARLDRVEIDGGLDPSKQHGAQAPKVDVMAVYRERNAPASTTGGKA